MADRSIVVRLKAEVADFKRAMDEAAASAKKVGSESEKGSGQATTALGRLTESATKNREAWTTAGVALTTFGAATTLAVAGTVRAAVEWESAWAGVTKTIDGTPAQLAAVEDGLRNLATTLPATHAEIAGVAEAAGQLGIATDDIVGFTRVMIDLGETTNLTAEEAATSIAQLMNIMGTAPADVERLGSALVALGNNGASTERDIIQMSQKIAAAGKIVGLTEGEVMAFANAISSVGIEVEAGGTAISRVMTDMAKAVSTGSDDLARFATVAGMSADDFAQAFRERPAEAINSFVEGLGRVQAAGGDVFTTLSDLGLSDVRVSQALLSMANAGDLLRESLELQGQAWADNTALVEEAGKRYDTAAARGQIALNTINDAAITVGEGLLPLLAGAADGIADLVSAFGSLPDPVQQVLGGLAGVAGVASLAAGGFLVLFPRVLETVAALRTLNAAHPGIVSGLGKAGKAAGVAAVAFLALSAAGAALGPKMDQSSIAQYTDALLRLGGAAESTANTPRLLADLAGSFDLVMNPGIWQQSNDAVRWFGELFGVTSDMEIRRREFDALGQSLESLYQSSPDLAAERFQAILAETGGTTQELLDLMPAYRDALIEAENAQTTVEASAAVAVQTYREWAGVTDELTEAQQALKDAAAGTAQAFTDPVAALQALSEAADGGIVSLDAWIRKLEEQAAAQEAWATNMILLSGRVSAGVLEELARLGPEGATLVAELVTGSEEQIAALEGVYGDGAKAAVDAFSDALLVSGPVIAAATAQLGEDAAREIATKLASGTADVEQIIAEYGLIIEGYTPVVTVETETEQAVADLEAVITVAWTTGDQKPVITVTQDGVTQTVADMDTAIATAKSVGSQRPTVVVTTNGVPQSVADLNSATSAAKGIPPGANTAVSTSGTDGARNSLLGVASAANSIPAFKTVTVTTKILGPAIPKGATGGLVQTGAIRGSFAGGGMVPGIPPRDPRLDNLLATGPGGLFAIRSGEFISTQDSAARNYAALVAGNKGATLSVAAYSPRASGAGVGTSVAAGPSADAIGQAVARYMGGITVELSNVRAMADTISGQIVRVHDRGI